MKRQRHPLWSVWHSMKQRCENPNRKDYKYYGGKGVMVCKEWKTFEGFLLSVPPRTSSKHTLDRVNGNGDYCPDNVRWATRKEQSINCSHSIIVEGKSLSDWSRSLGCSLSALCVRYAKYGSSCLAKNFVPEGIEFNGVKRTLGAWAKHIGISGPGLRRRIEAWGIEKALTTRKYATREGNRNACGSSRKT